MQNRRKHDRDNPLCSDGRESNMPSSYYYLITLLALLYSFSLCLASKMRDEVNQSICVVHSRTSAVASHNYRKFICMCYGLKFNTYIGQRRTPN